MPIAMTVQKKFRTLAAAAFAAGLLSGCASDDSAARFLVAPDKYVLYTCEEIAREIPVKMAREQELRALMVKAGDDPSGRLVSSLAYDPEYLSVRGEMNDLRASAAAKNCNAPPAAQAPAARTSGNAIH